MIKQNINTIVAIGMVLAVGIGVSYFIVDFAQNTEYSYPSNAYIVDAESSIKVGQ